MGRFKGVILDVDGTLVDSNDAHARAWVEAFAEAGMSVSYDRVRPLIGKGSDKLLVEAAGIEKDSPQGKQLSDRRSEIFRQRYLPHLRATPGAHDLLVQMRDAGLKLVVASSAEKAELTKLLKLAGALDLIEDKTSSGDVERSKPDPDVVHAAIESSGLEAGELVMLGDTPYDVEAAGRAHVASIAVRSGGWDDEHLQGALAVYDNPADLLAHYADSPLA